MRFLRMFSYTTFYYHFELFRYRNSLITNLDNSLSKYLYNYRLIDKENLLQNKFATYLHRNGT